MYSVEQFTKDNIEFISNCTSEIRECVLETLMVQGFHQNRYSFDDSIPIGAIYIVLSNIDKYFRDLGWIAMYKKLDDKNIAFQVTVMPRG